MTLARFDNRILSDRSFRIKEYRIHNPLKQSVCDAQLVVSRRLPRLILYRPYSNLVHVSSPVTISFNLLWSQCYNVSFFFSVIWHNSVFCSQVSNWGIHLTQTVQSFNCCFNIVIKKIRNSQRINILVIKTRQWSPCSGFIFSYFPVPFK